MSPIKLHIAQGVGDPGLGSMAKLEQSTRDTINESLLRLSLPVYSKFCWILDVLGLSYILVVILCPKVFDKY